MDELLQVLKELNPDVDYEHESNLIDGKILDSFSIISLISELSDSFDIAISPKYLISENFNSIEAMWSMIQKIRDED